MAMNFLFKILRRKEAVQSFLNGCQNQKGVNTCLQICQREFTTLTIEKSLLKQLVTSSLTQKYYSVQSIPKEEINNFYTDNKVTIIGKVPEPYIDIENNEFPDYIKEYLKNEGITKPTVIQSTGWPIALNKKNFVGIAQTGTGKTLAFLLPAIVHIKTTQERKGMGPIVLVLAPTRELARQIEQVAKTFQDLLGIRVACIYGGASRNVQANMLNRGVDLVIATPGRLNDFITSKVTNLSRCSYVVLDEADRMLDMGFEPQIRMALEGVPKERQIMMFSATWPDEVKELAMDYLGEYVQVNVGSTELTANHNINQHFYFCDDEQKMDKFKSIMHQISGDGYGKILVFANTKRFVDQLAMMLYRNGWKAVGIHGDKSQMQRDNIINKFKKGFAKILVATDVAARGLDVDGVTHVVNYDFPNTAEDYIHRIGRTGRSDSKGESHTILTAEHERVAQSVIGVLKEANQEVPDELLSMARSFKSSKYDKQQKFDRFKSKSWNPNRRWSKNRSYDNYDRYDRY